jgi:hypothetical protein
MLSKVVSLTRLKSVAFAALVAASVPSAQAYSGALGSLTPSLSSTLQVGVGFPSPTFTDSLSFTLDTAVTASFTAKGQSLEIPGVFTLWPASGLTFAVYKGSTELTPFSTGFYDLKLDAGTDYSFVVKGVSGGYTVTWALSAVPEPQSLALLCGGLAVVGSVARRRSQRR